jgi:hypothetical protein
LLLGGGLATLRLEQERAAGLGKGADVRYLLARALLRLLGIVARMLGRVLPRDLDGNGVDKRTSARLRWKP